ncbi:hypothetical protein K439DRAFT_1615305 [Ramaria rubella]|nr:hypothetical protein K439DRAFT_1615305 [Ramaria rubella]
MPHRNFDPSHLIMRCQGYTTKRRSPSDVGDWLPCHPLGIQRITNAQLPAQRQLDDEIRCANLQALPESLRCAAVHVVLDTGHMSGINEQMLADMEAWVDVPDDIGVPAGEVEIDPSHQGGEHFHFIDMAQDSFTRLTTENAGDIIDLTNMNGSHHDHLNESLIMHGLLGTVLVHPTLAIPIMTLELYCWCRLHCPQFSIQQWVKVLCDLSNINYRQAIQDQFSDAFDTYLVILCQVDQAINVQLNRNTGSCADEIKLAGETELNPSVMGAIDGNNSLKSDYFISHEYVDWFKNEVKRKPRAKADVEMEGDSTNGHSGEATCADRWCAATADTIKGVSNMFAKSGFFVSVCCHGLIWTIPDMM